MRPVVERELLRSRLEENKKRHVETYKKAMDLYREECTAALRQRLVLIQEGKPFDTFINVAPPENHEKDYDRALSAVNMHVGATIELSEKDVQCFIQDDWSWKHAWASNKYVETASAN
jgi:hypothetical protein